MTTRLLCLDLFLKPSQASGWKSGSGHDRRSLDDDTQSCDQWLTRSWGWLLHSGWKTLKIFEKKCSPQSKTRHVTRRDQTVCVMMVVRYYHMQYILKWTWVTKEDANTSWVVFVHWDGQYLKNKKQTPNPLWQRRAYLTDLALHVDQVICISFSQNLF